VVHFGLGPIGRLIAQAVAGRQYLRSAAAVDRDPNLAGCDLSELIGGAASGVRVTADADEALRLDAQVVLHSTVSRLSDAAPQLMQCISSGKRVIISTCEELAYPWRTQPELAKQIHAAALEGHSVVVGAGVNPGFAMDYLPLALSGAMAEVRSVTVRRTQDISGRRNRLKEKLGIGLTPNEFQRLVDTGRVGHIGLRESGDALAGALGWDLTRVVEAMNPMLAEAPAKSGAGGATDGMVTGVSQTLSGYVGRRLVLRLILELGVAVKASADEITLEGEPGIQMLVPGGIQGDLATAALSVNTIASAMGAAPGLRSMAELPPARPGPPLAVRS